MITDGLDGVCWFRWCFNVELWWCFGVELLGVRVMLGVEGMDAEGFRVTPLCVALSVFCLVFLSFSLYFQVLFLGSSLLCVMRSDEFRVWVRDWL